MPSSWWLDAGLWLIELYCFWLWYAENLSLSMKGYGCQQCVSKGFLNVLQWLNLAYRGIPSLKLMPDI